MANSKLVKLNAVFLIERFASTRELLARALKTTKAHSRELVGLLLASKKILYSFLLKLNDKEIRR